MFKEKRIFISGGAGVIGDYLVKLLQKEGAIIFVGDLKPRPSNWDYSVLYRQGDLNYIKKEELAAFDPEIFFHLAATFERSTETYSFWEENITHNVRLSNHLMTLLKDLPSLKQVIFASSYLIYDPSLYSFSSPQKQPVSLKENSPIYPRNMCGAAKLLHEIELSFLNHFKEDQFKTVCARIFRSYGKNSRDIVSRWIRDLIKQKPIHLFRPEGLFDYIYAKDVALGLMKLASSRASGVVNLGSGNARSVSEIVEILQKYFPQMKIIQKQSTIEYEASQADMSLFEKITQWKPTHSLEEAIKKIIRHEQEIAANTFSTQVVSKAPNILVTSISKKIPLLHKVREAIGQLGNEAILLGGDSDHNCLGKYFVDEFWLMPKTDDLNLETLVDYCKHKSIGFIIPTRDQELLFFSENIDKLKKQGINVMVSAKQALSKTLDKLAFYTELKEKLPVIPTFSQIAEQTEGTWVVKERHGAGSNSLMLNKSAHEAIEFARKLQQPVFQPFIEGVEYSVDCYITLKRKIKGIIVRTRDMVINGESQVTTIVNEPDIEKLVKKAAASFSLFGHVIFQIIQNPSNELFIVECNARFGGASTLSVSAGLNSFYWFLLESMGEDIDKVAFIKSKSNFKMIRHPEDCISVCNDETR